MRLPSSQNFPVGSFCEIARLTKLSHGEVADILTFSAWPSKKLTFCLCPKDHQGDTEEIRTRTDSQGEQNTDRQEGKEAFSHTLYTLVGLVDITNTSQAVRISMSRFWLLEHALIDSRPTSTACASNRQRIASFRLKHGESARSLCLSISAL